MTNQTETARALLYRHGLPEDIIDGALCLHAQELAAVQREFASQEDAHLRTTSAAVYVQGIRDGADRIDPTTAPASAGVATATDEADRRARYAAAIYEHTHPGSHWSDTSMPADWRPDYLDEAAAVMAVADAEQAELRARIADYENRITWHTTCASCARILDSSIRETERANQAEAAVERVRSAIHIADDEDVTDWQRGFRACHVVATQALADQPPAAAPAVDRASLRDRIADALMRWAEGNNDPKYAPVRRPDTVVKNAYSRADAVLAVLPDTSRAAACICGHIEAQHFEDACITEITGCDCGDFLTGEAAREVIARWREAVGTPDAEDPARIDRLRPEFTEHSSVEAIDAQLRRSRSQQRRWHLRTEWLISLRQRRTEQKASGEWPAASAVPAEPDTEA